MMETHDERFAVEAHPPRVPAFMGVAAGLVLLCIGAVVAVAFAGLIGQAVTAGARDSGQVILLAVLALIAFFCLSVGGRMTLRRPNRYGSIMPPFAWVVMGCAWLALAAWLAGTMLHDGRFEGNAWLPVFAGGFGVSCFWMAGYLQRRRRATEGHA